MKFQPDQFGAAITGYGPGWVAVAGQRLHHSLVLHSDGQRRAWAPRRFEDFSEADFALTTLNVYNAVAKRLQSV